MSRRPACLRPSTIKDRQQGAGTLEYATVTVAIAVIIAGVLSFAATTYPQAVGSAVAGSVCRVIDALSGSAPGACADPSVYSGEVSGPAPYEQRVWTHEDIFGGDLAGLGDSFGSGEGAGAYDEDSDRGPGWWQRRWESLPFNERSPENRCHRSAHAWMATIGDRHWGEDGYSFVACSGSTTSDVANDNAKGNDGEGPQIEAVTNDTSLILVSMGGNDAQFAPIITECLAANFVNGQTRSRGYAPPSAMVYCADYFDATDPDDPEGRSRIDVILDETEANLRQMFDDLRDASDDNAHIIQMGYPRLFDPDYVGLVDPKDVEYLNALADRLNARMAMVAAEKGVHFIDPTEAFEGHGIGSDDPWILGLGVAGQRALPPESYHPNAAGQAAMERLVQAYLDSLPRHP